MDEFRQQPRSHRRAPVLIGGQLRAGREQLGISLRELARRLGVSASMISQIERDQVNPSVSTLYALVSELGLTMGDIFTNNDPAAAEPAMAEPDRSFGASGPLVFAESRPV